MRGVLGWGTYVPYRRLDRTTVRPVAGGGGGKGSRAVASYDEDTTTMAVAAARAALRTVDVRPRSLWLATTTPTYLDKTNATAVHAALRLDRDVAAYDAAGSSRSTLAAVGAALDARSPVLVVSSDLRIGLPGGAEEAAAGDAGAAVLFGDDGDGPVLAEVIGRAALTEEFLDRWRVPGEPASRTWEERFGETRYLPLALEALKTALGAAAVDVNDVDALVVTGLHERACASVAKKSGVGPERVVDRLTSAIGNPGAAQPLLLLASALEAAAPGAVVVLLSLADGADALVLRTTDAITGYAAGNRDTVASQVAAGAPVSYGRYLAWRGLLPVEPPRRPEPARPSASAAGRNADWKFGLTGAAGVLADQQGTVTTFTIDKLAYSPSPPVVFAVVDFDDGARLPVELTDVDADDVAIGMRVEMTFRRLFTADGIANYFWKARPLRDGSDR
jgi:hydroxymethylglutaryl-CoA synthase